jgi:hypothetical protein
MQAGPSVDALNTLYGQPRYKDKILYKCVFCLDWNYAYYLTLMNSTFYVTDSFIIPLPVILSTSQYGKYLSNMNILHPQVIQGCRGVNASLESQVKNKPTQYKNLLFVAYLLFPDTCSLR